MRSNGVRLVFLWSSLLLISPPAFAAEDVWRITFYSQAGYAQQSLMNERADAIAGTWPGVNLERSIDVTPYALGLELTRKLSDEWFGGVRLDYGRAPLEWREPETATDPERSYYYFAEQESEIGEAMMIVGRSLCRSCTWIVPFIKGGAGVAYTESAFELELRPNPSNYRAAVDLPTVCSGIGAQSDGWFPVATLGLGVTGPIPGRNQWDWEAGAGYVWGRLNEEAEGEGCLSLPRQRGSTIEVETDLTGPSVWLGIAMRF